MLNYKKSNFKLNNRIRLGNCCIVNNIKDTYKPDRNCRLSTATFEKVKELSLQNTSDLFEIIKYCGENFINVLRISSDMFPHFLNPKAKFKFDDFSFCKDNLKKCAELIKEYKIRITAHPGQFITIGAEKQSIIDFSFAILKMHSDFLDILKYDNDPVIVIHGGGVYNDKQKTINRWIDNYHKLDTKIKEKLVLENCERSFSIEDCLFISEKTGVPVVLDTHHFDCYNIIHKENKLKHYISYYVPKVFETWKKKNIRPKFHISEQNKNKRVGAHSDFIENIPSCLLDIYDKYNMEIDIMIEAKEKENAIFKLYDNYKGFIIPINDDFKNHEITKKIVKRKYELNKISDNNKILNN